METWRMIKTVAWCTSGLVILSAAGFTLNSVFLKVIYEEIRQVERKVEALRQELLELRRPPGVEEDSEPEPDEEFHIALESLPSQSSIAHLDSLSECTDGQGDNELLNICRQIDDQHDSLKLTEQGCQQSREFIQQQSETYVNCAKLQWRLCRIMFEEAKHNIKSGLDGKDQLVSALEIAKQSVEIEPKNSKCHLWYAILLGDTCKYDDTKGKLLKGIDFDKHVRLCLDLDPYNSTALHLLGRYCFEVAGIKWWEARIAKALFGTVPESTYDEALQYFLKADDLNADWVENTLFIAKCLVNVNRREEARTWLGKVSRTGGDMEDEIAKQVAELEASLR